MFSRLSLEIVNLYFKAFIMNLYSQSNAMIAMRRGEASYKVKKLKFIVMFVQEITAWWQRTKSFQIGS